MTGAYFYDIGLDLVLAHDATVTPPFSPHKRVGIGFLHSIFIGA